VSRHERRLEAVQANQRFEIIRKILQQPIRAKRRAAFFTQRQKERFLVVHLLP
jgi:putative ubiquitin-RnfH superfamily antitoxin RatB of RatAB toxin-antitoxin module